MPTPSVVDEQYVLITVAKQNFTWEARILSRGIPYLPCKVSLPNRLKSGIHIRVGDVCLVNMNDADTGEGTADIMEQLDAKDIRKLRHKGIIPEEEEYRYLLVSDKKLGYVGGAFPYKAKLSGLGASTLPEDPDVIARARYLARMQRKEERKAANGGVTPPASPSTTTTPATTPPLCPSDKPTAGEENVMEQMDTLSLPTNANSGNVLSPIEPLPQSNVAAAKANASEDTDTGEESEEADGEDEGEADETDLTNVVNPNRPMVDKWAAHDGGVSKGYVSKRERRDLAMEQRLKKRAEGYGPKLSPSLIPQMEALDRVGGDADLASI